MAVIFTLVVYKTALVEIWNIALVAPAGMVTVGGTVAADMSSLERDTEVLVDDAAAKVTVPVALPPPLTEAALSVSEARETAGGGAVTVSVAV